MRNMSEELLQDAISLTISEVVSMKTCFLLTHVPNPKTNKRISVFKTRGEVSVVCTRRKSQDIWEPAYEDINYEIFDIDLPPSKKHLIKRVIISSNFQKKALDKLEKIHPNVIYANGLDSLIIAAKYKKRHQAVLFYDVADLREVYIERPRGLIKQMTINMIKEKEKNCFKAVNYLVITSPKFFDIYYHNLIDEKNTIYIPNAPDMTVFENYKRKNDGVFTVGFIGGVRYIEQMKMLVDAAEAIGCNVLFAGAGGTSTDYEDITQYCKGKDWVKFYGKYVYNTDIAKLYGMVDCVYAVYDADNPNVRIALPNKLYESVLCELPIIVAKNTYLSDLVNEWNVGAAVSHKNTDELIEALKRLRDDKEYYESIVRACQAKNTSDNSIELLKKI